MFYRIACDLISVCILLVTFFSFPGMPVNMQITQILHCLTPSGQRKADSKGLGLGDRLTGPCFLCIRSAGLLPTSVFDEVTARLYSGQRATWRGSL